MALRYDKHLPPFSNCKQAEKGGFCMHFSDAITEYCFDCKVRKLSPKSISNYQKQLKYLQRYMEQEFQIKNVEDVRSFHIKSFLSMMDDKDRSLSASRVPFRTTLYYYEVNRRRGSLPLLLF